MKTYSALRLKPLAACLAAAFAAAPAAALWADPAAAPAKRTAHANRLSPTAALVATRRGPSLRQVMSEAVERARDARPSPPDRPATTTLVTSCDDAGPGTLRDAVTNAVTGDTIDLSTLDCGTITLATGAIAATVDDLTIVGPGASALTIDGAHASGVLNHYGTGTLKLQSLTISNGYIAGQDFHGGACVLSAASVEIDDATISNCYAYMGHAYGGAICAVGDITLSNSTLSGNTTKGHYYYYYYPGYPNPYLINGTSWGGAAYASGRFTITNSTITHNTAVMNNRGSVGGGIAGGVGGHMIAGSTIDNNSGWLGGGIGILGAYGGDPLGMTIVNSTISGNSATISAGGVDSYRLAYTNVHNSTITDNYSAGYCGGLYVYYGATDLKSSIIAANRSLHNTNYFGYYTAADFDIFFNNATLGGDHNVIMTSNTPTPSDTIVADPNLMPLADNGGPTMTHAIDQSSVAADTGSNPDNLAYDQRGAGYPRTVGSATDIGAYEIYAGPPDRIFIDGFD